MHAPGRAPKANEDIATHVHDTTRLRDIDCGSMIDKGPRHIWRTACEMKIPNSTPSLPVRELLTAAVHTKTS